MKITRVAPQRKKSHALILLLFTGWIGGHHFYLREYIFASLYFLFFWTFIPFFLSLLELPFINRRVDHWNRCEKALYSDQFPDNNDLGAPCTRCGLNTGWVAFRELGYNPNNNQTSSNLFQWIAQRIPHLRQKPKEEEENRQICLLCQQELQKEKSLLYQQQKKKKQLTSKLASQTNTRGKMITLIIFSLIFFISGLGLLNFSFIQPFYHRIAYTFFWQPHQATVLESRVIKKFNMDHEFEGYTPEIRYQFQWQGETYTVQRLAFIAPRFEDGFIVQKQIDTIYAKGEIIPIRFPKAHPEQAVSLLHTEHGHQGATALFGSILLLISLINFWVLIKKPAIKK
ncbi:NINE protein [Magnetococcales bacterium HHB-1]